MIPTDDDENDDQREISLVFITVQCKRTNVSRATTEADCQSSEAPMRNDFQEIAPVAEHGRIREHDALSSDVHTLEIPASQQK